ncbi:hypothetical protein [Krasilnikovia sp. MM14-A1259]|uniref:hypothetical protein n=1 Tax=Krasilnikovia sp. MM14-A1259 TaxID=3373539 RepID=UPI00399C6BC7
MGHWPGREPYPGTGTGADGCRRSAQRDRDQADALLDGSSRRRALLESAERWQQQAVDLETQTWSTHTAPAPGDRVRAWVPCCPGQSVALQPPADDRLVQCRACHSTYRLSLVDELDGGWGAAWTANPQLDVLITRKHGVQPA